MMPERPDSLIEEGFEKEEEQTADSSRWVHFSKCFESRLSNINVEVCLRYTLYISDDPNGSWTQNTRYHFEGADMCVGSEDEEWRSQYFQLKIDSMKDINKVVYYLTGIR